MAIPSRIFALPLELNVAIVSCVQSPEIPKKVTSDEIKSRARTFVNISLVNKDFQTACAMVCTPAKLADLRRLNDLVNKYCAYNDTYKAYCGYPNPDSIPEGNPQLLDALYTGDERPLGSLVKRTFGSYSSEAVLCALGQDIRDIVRLTPQSMKCDLGQFRCRVWVPPLFVACANPTIPLATIEFLLQQGANPNAALIRNCFALPMYSDLDAIGGVDPERVEGIKALFVAYGYCADISGAAVLKLQQRFEHQRDT